MKRRDFLKALGITGGVTALAACGGHHVHHRHPHPKHPKHPKHPITGEIDASLVTCPDEIAKECGFRSEDAWKDATFSTPIYEPAPLTYETLENTYKQCLAQEFPPTFVPVIALDQWRRVQLNAKQNDWEHFYKVEQSDWQAIDPMDRLRMIVTARPVSFYQDQLPVLCRSAQVDPLMMRGYSPDSFFATSHQIRDHFEDRCRWELKEMCETAIDVARTINTEKWDKPEWDQALQLT